MASLLNPSDAIYACLIVAVVLLIGLIGSIVFFYRFIRTVEENQHNMLTQSLRVLNEKTDSHLDHLEASIKSFMDSNTKELSLWKNANVSFLNSQKSEFATFTNELKINYYEYVKKVSATNDSLLELIRLMNVSITNYNIVKDSLKKNYDKLELLSDKTTELISDNEKAISDFRQESDRAFELLKNTTEYRFSELTAEGEKSLSDSVRHNESQIIAVKERSIKEIGELLDSEHFKKFENEIKALYGLKEEFNAASRGVLEEIQGVNKELKLEMEALKPKKKKGFLNGLFQSS